VAGSDGHDYQNELYDSLHDSEMQRKFRALCPMPFGVVFLPWAGMTEEEMRQHFRWMKELGFTNLKQTMGTPQWPARRVLEVALEEGIIPFWYGDGGWQAVTEELFEQLGIEPGTPMAEIREHPSMLAYQNEVIRRRIAYPPIEPDMIEGTNLQEAGLADFVSTDVQLHNDPQLRPDAVDAFKRWVRKRYDTVDGLARAWTLNEVGICDEPFIDWDDFDSADLLQRVGRKGYGFTRDVLRFKADTFIARIRANLAALRARDPHEPQRAGGEMGLFLPFAWRGTDMEGIAEAMDEYGSFYPSIHLAWHYEEVGYEVARCIYMQASLAADWFKGGWSATWESTGGPQQFSGGKGWRTEVSEKATAGYTVDEGTITQLLLSYIAGGFRGVGLWAWNYRRAGWEGGEYALCNRQNRPGPRAVRAGKIARAADRLREELWAARKEPYVGVLVDWDNEAIWAAMTTVGRDHFKHYPVRARIGASRALINGNVPWEYVTARDIRRGLTSRYRVIVMPAFAAMAPDLLDLLETYIRSGGRLVLDAPGGWFDTNGLVLDTSAGSTFERIFGAEIADFQYSNNRPWHIAGRLLEGFVMDLNPTRAAVVTRFDHGAPAVTENTCSEGSAVILGYDASHEMFSPGNDVGETTFRRHVLGLHEPPYACDGAIVYRLAAPQADHYFFINDADATSVTLDTGEMVYQSVSDAISRQELPLGQPITLEPYSARWLRMAK